MFERTRFVASAALITVSACAHTPGTGVATAPAAASPDHAEPADDTAVARSGGAAGRELSRDGSRALARQTGEATYYGGKFDGRLTASGERYDPSAFTAAHRKLPFGTVVRVIRADDPSKVVYVRINDRGPHGDAKRVIDLSRAAAAELDMLRLGTLRVRLEVVEYGKGSKRSRR